MIPLGFEMTLLKQTALHLEGAIWFAERAGDPLGELPEMRRLAADIDARLKSIQK